MPAPRRSAPPAVAQSLRLFFALWPDDSTRQALDQWAAAMHVQCGGRRTKKENLHVTLAFLGTVPLSRVHELNDLATHMDAPAFELLLDQPGYWKHNAIAWLGTSSAPVALTGFAESLHARLSSAGLSFDPKPYVPHVTLVRDAGHLASMPGLEAVRWPVGCWCLVQSSGGRYTVVSTYVLHPRT